MISGCLYYYDITPPFTNAKNKVYSGQRTAFYLEQKDVTKIFNTRSITVGNKEVAVSWKMSSHPLKEKRTKV